MGVTHSLLLNSVAGAASAYADNRATAAKDLTKNVADKVKTAQDGIFGAEASRASSAIGSGKTKADSLTNLYLANLTGVLGQLGSNATATSPLTRQAQHDRLDEGITAEQSKLGYENSAALRERCHRKRRDKPAGSWE